MRRCSTPRFRTRGADGVCPLSVTGVAGWPLGWPPRPYFSSPRAREVAGGWLLLPLSPTGLLPEVIRYSFDDSATGLHRGAVFAVFGLARWRRPAFGSRAGRNPHGRAAVSLPTRDARCADARLTRGTQTEQWLTAGTRGECSTVGSTTCREFAAHIPPLPPIITQSVKPTYLVVNADYYAFDRRSAELEFLASAMPANSTTSVCSMRAAKCRGPGCRETPVLWAIARAVPVHLRHVITEETFAGRQDECLRLRALDRPRSHRILHQAGTDVR